jgi:uncharacterized protein YceK
MNPLSLKILSAAFGLIALTGCTTTTPHLDSKFGHAVNAAKAKQILHPEASKNTDPVAGIDGSPAKESIDRYQDTFRAPPPTFNVIDINTRGGSQ